MGALLSGRSALALAACVLAALTLTALGGADSLPGGTSFDVTIGSAAGPLQPTGPVTVNGTSSVGTGVATKNTALIYVLDLSGSTSQSVPGAACGNRNAPYDLLPDTRLDCELDAAEILNGLAITKGTVAKVGVIAFGGALQTIGRPVTDNAKSVDLDPASGQQQFIAPDAGPASPNNFFTQAMSSAFLDSLTTIIPATLGNGFDHFTHIDVGNNTNYWAAISRLKVVLTDPSVASLAKQVVFISDGDATEGSGTSSTLAQLMISIDPAVHIDSFAIGGGTCTTTSAYGDLQDIAGQPGLTPIRGTCTQVTNIALLPSILPNAVTSQLTGLTVQADGGPSSAGTVTPPLPQNGPTTVNWTKTITGLAAGLHHICATATGKDGGGTRSTQACTDVTLKDPPTVTIDGDGPDGTVGATPEGSPFALNASVGGATGTAWTSSGGTGTCSFGDATAPSTSVTCTDDGIYALRVTATDELGQATSRTVHLRVDNVPPGAVLTLSPAGPHPLADPITASVAITDPGADTFACLLAWGDGAPEAGVVSGTTCTGSHAYTSGGFYSVSVTVTDDDLGSGSDAQSVTIDAPPIVHARPEFGNEGSPVVLFATATDDVGVTGLEWSITGGTGTCAIADPHAASTTATCTDDGPYSAHVTVTDGINPPVSDDVTVNVLNVAPTVGALPVPGRVALGAPVTATFPFTDPGSGDTFECSIEWGDAIVTAGTIAGGACTGTHAYTTPGTKNATATVTDDNGGHGSNATPLSIVVDAPPIVSTGSGDLFASEGSSTVLGGVVSDDSGTPTLHWSSAGGADVDLGAVCVFGNAALAVTTVSCTDDGTFTLTLTASDGLNGPVSSAVTLHVSNVAPGLSLTGSASSLTASVTGTVTDAGSHDTHTCSFAWGDGSTTPGIAVAGGTCQASHAYASGTHSATVSVTASDDDGGTTSQSLTLTLNRPPSCSTASSSLTELWPPDHGLRLIVVGGGTDPDGDALSYAITSVRQDEPTNGTGDGDTAIDAVNAGPGAVRLRAERSGNGDGRVYTIAFTVSDGKGGSCSGSVQVTVPKSASKPAVLTPGPGYDSYH